MASANRPRQSWLPGATTRPGMPWVTLVLLGVTIAGFGVELHEVSDLDAFLLRWGLVPAELLAEFAMGNGAPAMVTLLTSLFLHASWVHLVANLVYLGMFGSQVERLLGHARYGFLYVLSGTAGGMTHVLAQSGATEPAIGASGAVAGVIGAYMVLAPGATLSTLAPMLFFSSAANVPTLLLLAVWLAAQVVGGVAGIGATSGVAWWAHLGGFAGGVLVTALVRRSRYISSG